MKIGILREEKSQDEKRVPFTPDQIYCLKRDYPQHDFMVQKSPYRIFDDITYGKKDINVNEDISDCDILMGIKEVPIDKIIPNKTYLFFSHTAKKQAYNKNLLIQCAKDGITLIDYEYLRSDGKRLASFGAWAGIIGTYNGIRGYAMMKTQREMAPPQKIMSYEGLVYESSSADLPIKICVTGKGNVGKGIISFLNDVGIRQLLPKEYLYYKGKKPVFTVLDIEDLFESRIGEGFNYEKFVKIPNEYISKLPLYLKHTNLLVTGHFWSPGFPILFEFKDLINTPLELVADITCDIDGSVPTTIKTSTIDSPYYGIDLNSKGLIPPFQPNGITVMAVDNLPASMPHLTSEYFGESLVKKVMPLILEETNNTILSDAIILDKGKLTEKFSYLEGYLRT